MNVPSLFADRRSYAGSLFGGIRETQEMLDFCAAHGIGAEIEPIPADRINEAFDRVLASDVRYRFVVDTSSPARHTCGALPQAVPQGVPQGVTTMSIAAVAALPRQSGGPHHEVDGGWKQSCGGRQARSPASPAPAPSRPPAALGSHQPDA